jgi:raffinose/stachyose/melibiose transport system permease protein
MQLISRPSEQTEAVARRPPTRSLESRVRRTSTILIFLLPGTVLYVALVVLPVIQAAYYSLFRWNGLDPLTDFVGLHNYVLALTSSIFLRSLADNLVILVLSIVVQVSLALILALIIGKNLPGRAIFRAIFFMPFILSEVITGVIWKFIFRPEGGLLNAVLLHLIPGFQGLLWLDDPKTVLGSVFIVIVWKYFGLYVVLYAAAIQNIPDEISDAARIDGASDLQVMRYITVPLLGTTIRLSILLSALGSLQIFDLIWVMTGGGPIHASEVMATYLITYGFRNFAMGYGSAIGVVMFLVCLIFALLYQRVVMQRDVAAAATGVA